MAEARLVAAARAELAEREISYPRQVRNGRKSAGEAGRGLAAWRAVAALLEAGSTGFEPCLGEKAADAWLEILRAIDAALEHRLVRAREDGGEERIGALQAVRSLMLRSAARAGVKLIDIGAFVPAGQQKIFA